MMIRMARFWILLLISSLLSGCLSAATQAYDPLLAIVIMIKNEARAIEETLQPYVDAGIKHFLVYDTGSTDDTVLVTEEFFKRHGVTHGVVIQEPFIDFSTSRNKALSLADQRFPQAAFYLMPDAEWYMKNVDKLVAYCKQEVDNAQCEGRIGSCPSYLVLIADPGEAFYTARLLRAKSRPRFAGDVHESIYPLITNSKVPSDAYFVLDPDKSGREASARRWLRDKNILLKNVLKDQTDTRALYYLAQTFECLGDWLNAYRYFKQRVKLNDFVYYPEENYRALYSLAWVTVKLAQIDASHSWLEALDYYMQAYAMRPTRAEPLVRIAEFYQSKNQHAVACLFARQAVKIPYPETDVLPVDGPVYRYLRYEIMDATCPKEQAPVIVDKPVVPEYAQQESMPDQLERVRVSITVR